MKSWMTLVIILQFSIFAHATNPCLSDIQKLCAGVPAGGGALAKCMKDKESKISAECRAQAQAMKERIQDKKEACGADVEKFCASLKAAGGKGVMKCLRANKEHLSDACKNSFDRKN